MRHSSQQSLPPMEVMPVDGRRSTTVNRVDATASAAVTEVDADRAWLGLVTRARSKAEMQHKTLAENMGVETGLLSAQISGVPGKHLSFKYMRKAGKPFWQELVLLIIDFYDLQIGLSEIDRRDMETGRALRELVTRSVAR